MKFRGAQAKARSKSSRGRTLTLLESSAHNLSDWGEWQTLYKFQVPRLFVACQVIPAEFDKLIRRRMGTGLQHNVSFDGLAPLLVGDTNDDALSDCRMAIKHVLNFLGVYVEGSGDDHVLFAIHD